MQPIGAETPADYLAAVLDLIENKAYFADNINNWSAIRQQARIMSGNARTPADTYTAIEMVLERTGQRHSFLVPAPQAAAAMDDHFTYGLAVLREERRIVQVVPGSPAHNADLQVGDRIIGVDDQMLRPADSLPHFDRLRRPIKLTVVRPSTDELLYVLLTPRRMVRDMLPRGLRIDSIGYLELPGIYDAPSHAMYIRLARDTLHAVTGDSKVKGWIVDLRRNEGGNLWPMLAAIGPIVGEGDLGWFIRRDNSRDVWRYEHGYSLMSGASMEGLPVDEDGLPDYGHVPVALLYSPVTGGAGEIVAIAFKGREQVRSFGEATSGNPTLNTDFALTDGARLALTTAACADRSGRLYLDSLLPDEMVVTDWETFGTEHDPVLQAGLKWLKSI